MGITTEQYAAAAKLLGSANRVLLTSHMRPDGDAIGCLVAMRQVLRALGKEAIAVLLDPATTRYDVLVEAEAMPVWGQDVTPADVVDVDTILILDTCAETQLDPIMAFIRSSNATKIALDHHATRDPVADHTLVDAHAPAATLLVWDWIKAMGWPVDEQTAVALFVGMSTDCGWFRFANTTPELMGACTELLARGVHADRLHQRLYQSEPACRLRLLGAMLNTLELHGEGRLAVLHLTRAMFTACGASPLDTEDLINEPQAISTVLVTALLVEEDDGRIRLSLRSKNNVDVSVIATRFGGGGHQKAAGARVAKPLDAFKQEVTDATLAAMRATE